MPSIDIKKVNKQASEQIIVSLDNVVKELLDNAIDAKASRIKIEFQNYGYDFVTITDNGEGMSKNDLSAALNFNSTSKISSFDDIKRVSTIGYRGEGLAAVFTMCKQITLVSKQKGQVNKNEITVSSDSNTFVEKHYDDNIDTSGTQVIVQNYMYNVRTARLTNTKQNKKKEFNGALKIIYNYAIVHCETLSFIVIHNQDVLMNTSNLNTYRAVLCALNSWTDENYDQFIVELNESINGQQVFGLFSTTKYMEQGLNKKLGYNAMQKVETSLDTNTKIEGGKSNRSMSYNSIFCVNNRCALCPSQILKSIGSIYRRVTSKAKFFYFLRVTTNEEYLDKNRSINKLQVTLETEYDIIRILEHKLSGLICSKSSFYGSQVFDSSLVQHFIYKTDEQPVPQNDHPHENSSFQIQDNENKFDSFAFFESLLPTKNNVESSPASSNFGVNESHDNLNNLQCENSMTDNCFYETSTRKTLYTNGASYMNEANKKHKINMPNNYGDITQSTTSKTSIPVNENNDNYFKTQKIIVEGQIEPEKSSNKILLSSHSSSSMSNSSFTYNTVKKNDISEKVHHVDLLVTTQRELRKGSKKTPNDESFSENCAETIHLKTILIQGHEEYISGDDSSIEYGRNSVKENNQYLPKLIIDENTVPNSFCIEENLSDYYKEKELIYTAAFDFDNLISDLKKNLSEIGIPINEYSSKNIDSQKTVRHLFFKELTVLGSYNTSFIVCRHETCIALVDQHAADEKFNFERLNHTTKINSQPLIIPKLLNLTIEQIYKLKSIMDTNLLKENGYEISVQDNKYYLEAVPLYNNIALKEQDLVQLIDISFASFNDVEKFCDDNSKHIWNFQRLGGLPRPPRLWNILAMKACRTSVMFGKQISLHVAKRIVENLAYLIHPWNCPHGRPTYKILANVLES